MAPSRRVGAMRSYHQSERWGMILACRRFGWANPGGSGPDVTEAVAWTPGRDALSSGARVSWRMQRFRSKSCRWVSRTNGVTLIQMNRFSPRGMPETDDPGERRRKGRGTTSTDCPTKPREGLILSQLVSAPWTSGSDRPRAHTSRCSLSVRSQVEEAFSPSSRTRNQPSSQRYCKCREDRTAFWITENHRIKIW